MPEGFPNDPKLPVSIQRGEDEWRIEGTGEGSQEPKKVRLSVWRAGQLLSQPLELSEEDLIELLQRGVRAGTLSNDFIGRLHTEIEI